MERKILCIDDDPALGELCGILSEEMGYDFVVETDPLHALNTFSEHPQEFAAVIVDLMMPHMKGDEVAQRLVNVRPDIPIILSTAYSEYMPKELDEVGIKAILLRPSTKREFVGALTKALG
jgi:CheY-like chemotaxis protein